MKRGFLKICCIFLIFIFISATACVAPPKSSGTQTAGTGGAASPDSGIATVTPEEALPIYVTVETPYGATPQKTAVPTATTIPPEEWVEIFHVKRPFGYNKTAFSFDVKNPPMMINVSLIPVNETGEKVIFVKKAGSGDIIEQTETYDRFSPYAWFEVKILDKNTGQILLQDGFGSSYGKLYSQELNQTMKIINKGPLQIEIDGNLIAATVNVSVKKEGNIPNTTSL